MSAERRFDELPGSPFLALGGTPVQPPRLRFRRVFSWFLVASVACGSACARRSPEPEPEPVPERLHLPPAPSSLTWNAPASWSLDKSANIGSYRAKYTVPAQGDAPNPAEVLVTRIGLGGLPELEPPLAELQRDFEGPEASSSTRRARTVRGFDLRELEIAGTYKFSVGPRLKQRAVAQVLQKNWRAVGVGVRTPSGELWFFRLVGPEHAVQAARSSFLSMLETLEVPVPLPPR